MTLQGYLKRRRLFEVGFGLTVGVLISTVNATTIVLEAARNNVTIDPLYPWIQEWTSTLIVLLLVPGVVIFCRKVKPSWSALGRTISWHTLGFLIFASLHLILMGSLRTLVWGAVDPSHVDTPQPWLLEFIYEARKDVLVYLFIIACTYTYEFILNRLQGEANFVAEAVSRQTPTAPAAPESQFLVKMLQQEYLVKVTEIDWIQSARNYVLLHCYEQGHPRAYPMRSTMQGVLDRLDPEIFCRSHRTAIVNLTAIQSIERDGDEHTLVLTGDQRVPLSKTFESDLKTRLSSLN